MAPQFPPSAERAGGCFDRLETVVGDVVSTSLLERERTGTAALTVDTGSRRESLPRGPRCRRALDRPPGMGRAGGRSSWVLGPPQQRRASVVQPCRRPSQFSECARRTPSRAVTRAAHRAKPRPGCETPRRGFAAERERALARAAASNLTDGAFHLDVDEAVHLDRVLERELFDDRLDEPRD